MKNIIPILVTFLLINQFSGLKAQLIGEENTDCIVCAQVTPECKENERYVPQTCESCAHCEPIDVPKIIQTPTASLSDCQKCKFNFECKPKDKCINECCTPIVQEIKEKECIICAQVVPVCKKDEKLVPQTCEKCAYCEKTKKLKKITSNCNNPCGDKCCKSSEKCVVFDQCKSIKSKCKLPILRYCSTRIPEELKGKIIKQL